MVLPAGKGTGGAARTSGWVRTVWAHEKTNLDLWADQPLARLPSWLYSLPRGAQGIAMILVVGTPLSMFTATSYLFLLSTPVFSTY